MKIVSIVFCFFFLSMSVHVNAQVKKVLADKIIGTVGDKFILKSDIENTMLDMKRQAQGEENIILPNSCQIVEQQLIRKALVLQAEKDSLIVTEEEVENAIDMRIRQFLQQFGSKEVLEEVAGRSIFQLKDDFKILIKEQKLADEMQQKIVDKVKITPTEVRAFYNQIPIDSLPLYESEVQISEIIMHPKANRDIEEYVIQQMLEYRKQVENGVNKFEQLVKLYSEDEETKMNCGFFTDPNIGSQRIPFDYLDKAMAATVSNMKVGTYSEPQTGYAQDGSPYFRVLYLQSETKPHVANLEQDWQRIQAMALEEKKSKQLDIWSENKRKEIILISHTLQASLNYFLRRILDLYSLYFVGYTFAWEYPSF